MTNRRSRLRRLFPLLLLAALVLLPACGEQNGAPPEALPNIVFLFSDDHSVPDLGSYGNPHIQTPHLDQLAAVGMRFTRAYVASSQCSPSRAAIFTGQSPHSVGASRLHANLRASTPTIVEMLKKQGYHTGAYRKVHQKDVQTRFDFYGNKDTKLDVFFAKRPQNKPFFLWFGSSDPHRKYGPGAFDPPHDPSQVTVPEYLPDTPEVRQDLAYYYDEIARFDKECGEIMSYLERDGLTDNTMIVMAGDNGLPFPRAKGTCYEVGVNVPLLIAWPGKITPGKVTDALVSLIDLPATWLDIAGIALPADMQGRPLTGLLTGGDYTPREFVFTERNWHDNWDPIRSVVTRRWKLIQNYRPEQGYRPSLDIEDSPSWAAIQQRLGQGPQRDRLEWYRAATRPQVELYDREQDPGEWHNLAEDPAQQNRIVELQKVLSEWIQETNDFLPAPYGSFPPGGRYKDLNPL